MENGDVFFMIRVIGYYTNSEGNRIIFRDDRYGCDLDSLEYVVSYQLRCDLLRLADSNDKFYFKAVRRNGKSLTKISVWYGYHDANGNKI